MFFIDCIKNTKKIHTLLFALLFCMQGVFAITDANSDGFVVFGNLGFLTQRSVEKDNVNGSINGIYKRNDVEIHSGFRFSQVDFQCMAEVFYYPLNLKKISMGFNGLVQYQRNFKLFSETNFHLGASIVFSPIPSARIFFDCSYAPKITVVDALKVRNLNSRIVDNEIAFRLGFKGTIENHWVVEAAILSYEDYSYPLFLWPSFCFGLTNYSRNGVVLGFKSAVHYTDMFTLTSYFDSFEFQLTAGYKF